MKVRDLIARFSPDDLDLDVGFAVDSGPEIEVLSVYRDNIDDPDRAPAKIWIDLGPAS